MSGRTHFLPPRRTRPVRMAPSRSSSNGALRSPASHRRSRRLVDTRDSEYGCGLAVTALSGCWWCAARHGRAGTGPPQPSIPRFSGQCFSDVMVQVMPAVSSEWTAPPANVRSGSGKRARQPKATHHASRECLLAGTLDAVGARRRGVAELPSGRLVRGRRWSARTTTPAEHGLYALWHDPNPHGRTPG